MAFRKYAYARTVDHFVSKQKWSQVRTASGSPSSNLLMQASEILGESFDPSRYLLSHATIVCSVNTEKVPGIRVGSVVDPKTGSRINRKWEDFRVSPECDMFINNNQDAWSRDVLLKSYRTFVGGHNFCEHVQKLEESKGRIIDAVARDIGPSLYVDILIATDRRHTALVRDILNGKMGTLSMGCSVTETICTKCGNVAADDTEMCDHIRYEKGNRFLDDRGQPHRVAELCGHSSLDPTGGVNFIEASWVATPAFGGAVVRNLLNPDYIKGEVLQKAAQVLKAPPKEWVSGSLARVSSEHIAFEDQEDDGTPLPEETKEEKKPLDELGDDVYEMVMQKVRTRVQDDLQGVKDKPSRQEPAHSTGEDLIKQAKILKSAEYKAGLGLLMKSATSDAHLLDSLARFNRRMGVEIPRSLYVCALGVGPISKYGSVEEWAVSCHSTLNRVPTSKEVKTLFRLAFLLDKWSALPTGTH